MSKGPAGPNHKGSQRSFKCDGCISGFFISKKPNTTNHCTDIAAIYQRGLGTSIVVGELLSIKSYPLLHPSPPGGQCWWYFHILGIILQHPKVTAKGHRSIVSNGQLTVFNDNGMSPWYLFGCFCRIWSASGQSNPTLTCRKTCRAWCLCWWPSFCVVRWRDL